jgi:hypothetical protein
MYDSEIVCVFNLSNSIILLILIDTIITEFIIGSLCFFCGKVVNNTHVSTFLEQELDRIDLIVQTRHDQRTS